MTLTGNTITTLGEQLRLMRQRAGLSQSELAEKAGLHRNTVSKIEKDDENVTLDTLQAVCGALGYVVDVRFNEKETASE